MLSGVTSHVLQRPVPQSVRQPRLFSFSVFVSPSGVDNPANGSATNPVRTFQFAANLARDTNATVVEYAYSGENVHAKPSREYACPPAVAPASAVPQRSSAWKSA